MLLSLSYNHSRTIEPLWLNVIAKLLVALEGYQVAQKIRMPERSIEDFSLRIVDVEKLDQAWANSSAYISPGGTTNVISDRYARFIKFLLTNPRTINASEIDEIEENPEHLIIDFLNGRHRFAVMRDMGIKYLPMAISKCMMPMFEKHRLVL